MLKAELLNRGESIYFSDKPNRTLSVEGVIKKIYTDKHTRVRLNLEKIIELRNISTHDVLSLIIDFYDIKQDQKYAYKHVIGKQEQYTYSQQFIDFIIDEIAKNPRGFVDSLKKSK